MLEIHHSNSRKHARSPQVHLQRKFSLFFLHGLNGQLGIEPFPFLNDTCARQGMVYAAVFLERSLEQRNIVCVFSDVCKEKGDRGGRGEGREESFRGF